MTKLGSKRSRARVHVIVTGIEGEVVLLNTAQREFFVRNGYLQIPAAVSRDDCDYLVDRSWEHLPQAWDRRSPDSWTGAVTDSCHTSGLTYRRGHLKFQKGALQTDQRVQATFNANSHVGQYARQLFGGKVAVRYRGLYMIVPFTESGQVRRISGPHVEAHPVQIVSTTYLNDVEEDAGGLLVWPGSHHELYPAFDSKTEFQVSENYKEIVGKYRSYQPVELTGKAGDVIFIHHRLLHAPGLNRSENIRFALFVDYMTESFVGLANQVPGQNAWEDWRGMDDVAADAMSTDHVYQPINPNDLIGMAPKPDHYTTQNKRDATDVIRSLKEGDVWITLSDSPSLSGSNRIEPCGLNLAGNGVAVTCHGEAVRSVTTNDIVAPLPHGVDMPLEITGVDQPLWLRVVRVSRPVMSSSVLVDTLITESGSIALS
jgi:hypothetical protein